MLTDVLTFQFIKNVSCFQMYKEGGVFITFIKMDVYVYLYLSVCVYVCVCVCVCLEVGVQVSVSM